MSASTHDNNTTARTAAAGQLAGIRVLDFGRIIAAPFVGQILGDLGADVIKIERFPDGDETRAYGEKPDSSAIFTALNRNKRSVAVDMANPGARKVLDALLKDADVVIHNFRHGVMAKLGLAAEDVWRINPRIVYCGISGFGTTGPLARKPGNDVTVQAFSGLMSYIGDEGSPPTRVPVSIGDYTAGLYAAIGILSALVERNVTGRGREVQTSLLEGMLAMESLQVGDFLTKGTLPPRLASGNMFGQPNQAFPTRDGAVVIAALHEDMWQRFSRAMGHGLADDPRFKTRHERFVHREALAAIIEDITMSMDTAQCVAILERAEVICSPINDIAAATLHEQVAALGILQALPGKDQPETVGSPLVVDGQRPQVKTHPPSLGQHSREVLAQLGFSPEDIEDLRKTGAIASK